MEPDENVKSILAHLVRQAEAAADEYPYDALFVHTGLPIESLAKLGTVVTHEQTDADEAPYFQIETDTGFIEVQVCPFGHLALVSHEEGGDAARVEQVLVKEGIAVTTPGELAKMPAWCGHPLTDWLFPQRLSDVLALFDWLRTRHQIG